MGVICATCPQRCPYGRCGIGGSISQRKTTKHRLTTVERGPPRMHEFLVYTISGLTTAGIYAITASGLTLTYVTTGVFNFAHGATGALAAFTYWQMRYGWGWPAPIAIIATLFIIAPLLG